MSMSKYDKGIKENSAQSSSGGGGGFSKATARSFLSNGGGVEASSAVSTGPLIEGNVATLGGIDCGDEVISIQHTENGAALCTSRPCSVTYDLSANGGANRRLKNEMLLILLALYLSS